MEDACTVLSKTETVLIQSSSEMWADLSKGSMASAAHSDKFGGLLLVLLLL